MNWFALEEKDPTGLQKLAHTGGAIARINPIVSCFEGGYTATTGRDAQNPSVEVDTADRVQAGAQATAEVGGGVLKTIKAAFGIFGVLKCNKAATTASSTLDATKWTWGREKGVAKSIRQMTKRGWSPEQVTEAIRSGEQFPAVNNVNKGNPAIRYVHPQTGQSVVQDMVTFEILHFGGPGFNYP